MFEFLGYASGIIAIIGVVLNNYERRVCFLLWLVSNTASAVIHAHTQTWSLFWRDVVFLGLALHGWWAWGRKKEIKK